MILDNLFNFGTVDKFLGDCGFELQTNSRIIDEVWAALKNNDGSMDVTLFQSGCEYTISNGDGFVDGGLMLTKDLLGLLNLAFITICSSVGDCDVSIGSDHWRFTID